MYSRNVSVDSINSRLKLNHNGINSMNSVQKENIPVKSFTDNFAYERFNMMGNDKNKNKENNPLTEKVENTVPNVSEKIENLSEKAVVLSGTDNHITDETEDTKNPSGNALLLKLKTLFDSDTVLIVLAVLIVLLSEHTTNDKLTPLALLAILIF